MMTTDEVRNEWLMPYEIRNLERGSFHPPLRVATPEYTALVLPIVERQFGACAVLYRGVEMRKEDLEFLGIRHTGVQARVRTAANTNGGGK